MLELTIKRTENPGIKPDDDKLGFGSIFTDHMFVMDYSPEKGWHSPQIVPYGELAIFPSAMVFHYGQTIFEGAKAYYSKDGNVLLFRIMDNLNRLNRSATQVCVPTIDPQFVLECLKKLLEIDKEWIPKSYGTSMYIRPVIIATEPYVGLKSSSTFKFIIILSPVGAYYSKGFNPVSIKVEDKYVRAPKGGLGEAKTAANYAASLRSAKEAKEEGFDQVLWLDAIERKYVEEVGTSNIFFKINEAIITPPLEGTILPGITRDSVIKIAGDWGYNVKEQKITIDEVFEAHSKGELEEVFASGTAAVISPVGRITWKGKTIEINNNQTGQLASKLFDEITGIQYGKIKDKFGWVQVAVKG